VSEFKRVTGSIPAGEPMHYKLVPVSRDNVDQVAEIEKECFSTPWSREMLLEAMENLTASFIAAEADDGTILGYAGVNVVMDEGYIDNVAVRKAYRRNGVASALLDVFIRFAQAHELAFLTLEVRSSKEAAIALYPRHGFEEAGRRKNYYSDPKEDAIIMTRTFKKVSE
jgi:[ribosomal protein S18]-alanine N-acetyltransferase